MPVLTQPETEPLLNLHRRWFEVFRRRLVWQLSWKLEQRIGDRSIQRCAKFHVCMPIFWDFWPQNTKFVNFVVPCSTSMKFILFIYATILYECLKYGVFRIINDGFVGKKSRSGKFPLNFHSTINAVVLIYNGELYYLDARISCLAKCKPHNGARNERSLEKNADTPYQPCHTSPLLANTALFYSFLCFSCDICLMWINEYS